MISYGLRNFRRLEAVAPISLKPITILVGKNSSGKSSYLRSLPLLKQSVSPTTAGAILWWGELVDFGSYEATLRKGSKKKAIGFDFEIPDFNIFQLRYNVPHHGPDPLIGNIKGLVIRHIRLSVDIDQNNDKPTHVSNLELNVGNFKFNLKFDENGKSSSIEIDEIALPKYASNFEFSWSGSSLFGLMFRSGHASSTFREVKPEAYDSESNLLLFVAENKNLLRRAAPGVHLSNDSYGFGLAYYTLNRWLGTTITPDPDGEELLENMSIKTYEKLATAIGNDRLIRLCLLTYLPFFYNCISTHLRNFVDSISYIGPARARSERYYRKQDLSVSTIAPDGTNFPMWLASLSDRQVEEFSKLTARLCGYKIKPLRESGHISIILKAPGGFDINLIDAGYGLSQILPVLAQMWSLSSRSRNDRYLDYTVTDRIVAIEQPELHLHPAHQTTLAEAFVDFSKIERSEQPNPLKFLIETHSEDLINRFGSLIFEGKLSKDDVQIVIFNDFIDSHKPQVEISTFDDTGALINWPYGFFAR